MQSSYAFFSTELAELKSACASEFAFLIAACKLLRMSEARLPRCSADIDSDSEAPDGT